MNLLRLFPLLTLSLAACDAATNDAYRAPPLATLRGTMTASQGLVAGGSVRLSVLWFSSEGGQPGSLLGVLSDEVAYTGMFPQAYTLELEGLPPIGAVRADDAGTVGAVGVLVAYEDTNGDGRLTLSRGGPVVDRVLGASARSLVDARRGVISSVSKYLLYLDTVGTTFGQVAPGYHLYTVVVGDGGVGTSRMEPVSAATLPLELTGDAELALVACGELYDSLGTVDFATKPLCGLGPGMGRPGPMTMTGQISILGDAGLASITLGVPLLDGGIDVAPEAMDASVSLNGRRLESFRPGSFSLYELQATVVREVNVVRVEVAGLMPFERQCVVPTPVTVTVPRSVATGQSATVSWMAPMNSFVVATLGAQNASSPATSVTAQAQGTAGMMSYLVSASGHSPLSAPPLQCSRIFSGSIPVTP